MKKQDFNTQHEDPKKNTTKRKTSPKQHILKTTIALSATCFVLSIFGCNELTEKTKIIVELPPTIPTASAPHHHTTHPHKAPKALSQTELLKKPATQKLLTKAIRLGMVSEEDSTSPEKLKLLKPISHGEFAEWLATAKGIQPTHPPVPSYHDVSLSHPQYGFIEAVREQGLLRGHTQGNRHYFKPNTPITREGLCEIHIEATRKKEGLKQLKTLEFSEMRPDSANGATAFQDFNDYTLISEEHRKAVAVAYRDGILNDVFDLEPEELTTNPGQGFIPQKEVTRLQALNYLTKYF